MNNHRRQEDVMKMVNGISAVIIVAYCLVLAQDTATTSEPVKIAKQEIVKVIKGTLVLAQDTATTSEPVKIAKQEIVKVITGTVVFSNANAGTVIIKSWQAEDTIMITEKTGINVGHEHIKLTDLNVDDNVTVYYIVEKGNKMALEIIKKAVVPAIPPSDSGNK